MPNDSLKIALCQLNLTTGDFEGNFRKAKEAVLENEADIYVFPECQVTNHPSGDLFLCPDYVSEAMLKVKDYVKLSGDTGKTLVFGCPMAWDGRRPESTVVVADAGSVRFTSRKSHLSAGGCDDARWFVRERQAVEAFFLEVSGGRHLNIGYCVGDDYTFPDVVRALAKYGADIVISLSSSPYCAGADEKRRAALRQRVGENGVPVVFVNQVGGNDELVWDGRSMALDPDGNVFESLPWAETVDVVTMERRDGRWKVAACKAAQSPPSDTELYVAASTGLRDYLAKTGFKTAVVGLSGGADSALVALMAADVLGAANVHFVMMPTDFTSGASNSLALDLASSLGSSSCFVSVQPLFDAYREALAAACGVTEPNVAEENLQAQIRGDLLSWYSNKFGAMILSTGNKSEVAMGYATLYGDMRGGFNPLKDIYKTEVFQLLEMRLASALGTRGDFDDFFSSALGRAPAALRNTRDYDGPAALRAIIDRPPSAELAEGQLDSDSLPDYPVLDAVLQAMLEGGSNPGNENVARMTGQPLETVEGIRRRIRAMEYKRFQACPGPKLHPMSFTTRDWRYPMASKYRK